MAYKGGCHCGNIAFEVDGEIDQVIECNCSICSKRGYLLWFVPRANLHFDGPETSMSTYTFNQHRIRHQFCPTCGVAPFGMGTDGEGNETAAMNVRCLEGVELSTLKIVPYDGRSA
jgi:hypothetical protein